MPILASWILLMSAVLGSPASPAIARIKDEALLRSHVMEAVEYLSDVVGPRLTGSAGLRRAQEYATDWLRASGAEAHLEPWGPFGRGWELERTSAVMTHPSYASLIAYPAAWSPSTAGVVTGAPVLLNAPDVSALQHYHGRLQGRIVLMAPERPLDPLFQTQTGHRLTDDELKTLEDAPAAGPFRPPVVRDTGAAEFDMQKWRFVAAEHPAVVLSPAYWDGGTVYVTSAVAPNDPATPPAQRVQPWNVHAVNVPPQMVVGAEQYNRLVRLVRQGVAVSLTIEIRARFTGDRVMSADVIGEIPGTDLRDQIVMIGGCLDSWHAGTGATDNAAGAAVVLEVARILHDLRLTPRRTIRFALWSAEEQGGFGSRAYVASHFGRRSADGQVQKAPDYDRLSAYFNLDYGTGRIRGIYAQGNSAAKPVLQEWLAPLADIGASTVTLRNIGATDHLAFDDIGLPGFQFLRDYMEGGSRTGHTNMDVYDHVLPDDLRQSAAVAASVVYEAAMSPEKLPRR